MRSEFETLDLTSRLVQFILITALLSQLTFERLWMPNQVVLSAFQTGEGNATRQIGYALIFLLALAPFRSGVFVRLVYTLPILLWMMLLWFLLTLLWSPVPDIAARRLVLTILISMAIFLIVDQMHAETTIRFLLRAFVTIAVVGLLTAIVLPSVGIHQLQDSTMNVVGDWRGLSAHKNVFGAIMAIGGLFSLHAWRAAKRQKRRPSFGALMMCLFMLYMSGSKTSLGLFLIAATLYLILNYGLDNPLGGRALFSMAFALSCAVGLTTVILFGPTSGEGLITPESFTGRGLIWAYVFNLLQGYEFFGRGYQSVFAVGEDTAFIGMVHVLELENIVHAHNAYLEVLVSTGFMGFVFMLVACVFAPIVAVRRMPQVHLRPLLYAVLSFCYLHGMLEVGLTDRDRTTWVMVLFVYAIARQDRRLGLCAKKLRASHGGTFPRSSVNGRASTASSAAGRWLGYGRTSWMP